MNPTFTFTTERIIYLVIIVALISVLLIRLLSDYGKRRVVRRRFERGKKLEERARGFLISKGFKILGEQAEFEHIYNIDGTEGSSILMVDYLVSRRGKKYIVEVKSGTAATSIHNSNTRRQLLEYHFAIECDGIFLLDMEAEELHKIDFIPKESHRGHKWILIALLIGMAGIWLPGFIPKVIVSIILLMIIIFRRQIYG